MADPIHMVSCSTLRRESEARVTAELERRAARVRPMIAEQLATAGLLTRCPECQRAVDVDAENQGHAPSCVLLARRRALAPQRPPIQPPPDLRAHMVLDRELRAMGGSAPVAELVTFLDAVAVDAIIRSRDLDDSESTDVDELLILQICGLLAGHDPKLQRRVLVAALSATTIDQEGD